MSALELRSQADTTVSRPPILFVHGTFGSGELLRPWVRCFEAEGFDCLAPSLPGRVPADQDALRRLGMRDYLEALLEVRATMAVAPPGVLWAQPRAMPHLIRMLAKILAGRPVLPSEKTLRAVVFHDLPESEQRELVAGIVPDSGRAFRSLILGTARVPRGAVRCPVLCLSGAADRNVSGASRARSPLATTPSSRVPKRGHWLVAESGVQEIAPVILSWLQKVLGARTSSNVRASAA